MDAWTPRTHKVATSPFPSLLISLMNVSEVVVVVVLVVVVVVVVAIVVVADRFVFWKQSVSSK